MTTKKLIVLIMVLGIAISVMGCDSLMGSSGGGSNGNDSEESNGSDGPVDTGKAEFTVSGDADETIEEGAAFFRTLDDDRFQLIIAETWPFGSSIRVELDYHASDSGFSPDEVEYDVQVVPTNDTWTGALWNVTPESIGINAGTDASVSTLSIDSASSDLIEGSLELHFIYPDDGTEYSVSGTFEAVPAPY